MPDQIELISASLEALTESLRATAHNIANVNTTGYKRLHGSFGQELAEEIEGQEAAEAALDFTQGGLIRTGRPLDLALRGKGFFVIETPQGNLYTRNGTFTANATGQLVDTSGRTVAGVSGPITIPASVSPMQVTVSTEGYVAAAGARVGQLRIVEFADTSTLRSVGASCFEQTDPAEPTAAAETSVQQ